MQWQNAQKSYLNSLKGIEIIAVTMVLIGAGNLPGMLGQIGNAGAHGVEMFLSFLDS